MFGIKTQRAQSGGELCGAVHGDDACGTGFAGETDEVVVVRMIRERQRMIHAEPIRVVDKNMVDVPRDGTTIGEIVMRGNNVMTGYFADDKATAEAFRGGAMHSGDLGVVAARMGGARRGISLWMARDAEAVQLAEQREGRALARAPVHIRPHAGHGEPHAVVFDAKP